MSDRSIATRDANGQSNLIEQVVIQGNLANLSPQDRAAYYAKVCESVGLNPLTRPFEYLTLNGKLILYARKDATDQLRSLRKVSLTIVSREIVTDLYVVTARATLPDGRADEEIGAVPIAGLKGEALANAMMKASTKAKRRVTLSVVGLGWLDESEVSSIAEARPAHVDADGVIHERGAALPDPDLAERQRMVKAMNPPVVTPPTVPVLLEEAREVEAAARALGLRPTTPSATATDAALLKWINHWEQQIEAARIGPEAAPAAEATPVNTPPATRAEMALIGSIIIDPEAIGAVAAIVAPADVTRPKLRLIYEAALALHARGLPPDYVALCCELEARGTLDAVGGDGALTRLVNECPSSLYATQYARLVAAPAATPAVVEELDGHEAARALAVWADGGAMRLDLLGHDLPLLGQAAVRLADGGADRWWALQEACLPAGAGHVLDAATRYRDRAGTLPATRVVELAACPVCDQPIRNYYRKEDGFTPGATCMRGHFSRGLFAPPSDTETGGLPRGAVPV